MAGRICQRKLYDTFGISKQIQMTMKIFVWCRNILTCLRTMEIHLRKGLLKMHPRQKVEGKSMPRRFVIDGYLFSSSLIGKAHNSIEQVYCDAMVGDTDSIDASSITDDSTQKDEMIEKLQNEVTRLTTLLSDIQTPEGQGKTYAHMVEKVNMFQQLLCLCHKH